MSNFLVSNNFDNGALALNSDRRNIQTMADESQVDFAGASYNNATNTASNAELGATNTTNYNNIEVTHNNDKNGYAAFNFNLGTTGVVDGNTDATKGTSQNAAAGTKTVQGAAGNSGTAGANYTSSGNNQVINYYVPTLTVDKYGRLTNVGTTNAWNLNAGVGLGMDASGNIVINDNGSNGLTFLNGGDTLYVHLRDNGTTTQPSGRTGTSGGLMISGDQLQVNAPTCLNNSSNPGRLTWTGNAFNCQYITETGAGTYGSTSGSTIQIPVISINGSHEFTVSTSSISASGAVSLSNGVFSVDLGDGLKLSDDPSSPGITIDLYDNGGLTMIGSQLALVNCSVDKQILKWDNSAKRWGCKKDEDTMTDYPAVSGSGSAGQENVLMVPVLDANKNVYYNWWVNTDVTISSGKDIGDGWYGPYTVCLPVKPQSNTGTYAAYAVVASVDGGGGPDGGYASGIKLENGIGYSGSSCTVPVDKALTGIQGQFWVYSPGSSGVSDVDAAFVYTSR
jgi:hypothetical protein